MKSNAFGLDIGTTTIKMVYLSHENNIFGYNSSILAPTPTPGMQSESSFDHQEMAQFIKKYVLDAKITTNNVNIALPENQVFTKVIDMPILTDKELASAIYWEAEQYVPAQLDTMTLDWKVLRTPTDRTSEQKMQVLLVAAPTHLVKKYQEILDIVGLNVVSVETEILSVIRSIGQAPNSPTFILLHIGALSTTLSIVQKGIILFNYSIPLGGIAMTRGIASDFGFSPTQAEEYKRVYGLSDKNLGGKVGRAIEPILTEILSEIKKAIAFYSEKYKNESPVSQILLTGGNARLPGIDLYFVKNIGIETVIANPWKLLNIQNVPESVQADAPEYAVAIGLALKEYE
jgi:type IV pilus assembly protein PilM